MDKQEILARLDKQAFYSREVPSLKSNGAGTAMGLCPFHDDHNPSLSVNFNDGRFFCFGCNEKGSAFDFYMKRYGVDFPAALDALGREAGITVVVPKRKIVKTYDYMDEAGTLLFQTVRYEPKDFGQRRPDGKGGWIYNLQGVRLVPYNLPFKDPGIIIVEGEKDVDRLKALGLPASTSPMGAGKWRQEYNEHFKGKHVAILPDNDDPGRKHAQAIARNLHGIAGLIRIVELPGLPPKGDASDWIAQGGTKAKLIELITQTPDWTPPPAETSSAALAGAGTIPDEWPDPIPLNRYLDLAPFPLDSLPEFGRELVKTVSDVCQVDPGLPGSQYLAVLSTALGGKFKVNLKTHTEPCNLYLAQMLDSGERKSKTTSIMTGPVYQYQIEKAGDMADKIREARNQDKVREARLARLQRKAAEADEETERRDLIRQAKEVADEIARNPVPKSPVYIFDDITPEKVGEIMAEHGERGSIITPEGGIFDIMAGRYSEGKTNLDIWLKAHAGDPWSCHRIGRDAVSMRSPALTLSLAIQSSVIREIGQDERFRGRGLLARFLYSMCRSQVGQRERQTVEIPDALQREYEAHVKRLMDIPKSEKYITLSQDGQALWDEFYNDVEHEMRPGGPLECLKAWGSKLPGAAARIAGLLHVAEHGAQAIDQTVSVETVRAAAVLGGYFKEHALAIFGYMGEDPKTEAAKLILEYINHHGPETFKGRDVLMNKNAFKTMEEVQPGLSILIERGYIREMERKRPEGRGRPEAPPYEVNPKALEIHQQ